MSVKLFFAGDVVLADDCYDPVLLAEDLQAKIAECNLVCCNFEAPVKNEFLLPKKKIGPNNSNSAGAISSLKKSGFNFVTLANNHIFDYGVEGIEATLRALDDEGINHIGAGVDRESIYRPYIFNCEDVVVGVINAAENGFGAAIDEQSYGYAYIFGDEIKDSVRNLKNTCDIVILISHAGAEMWDVPLPEWRQIYREFIDLGVSAVIAHHPHVPQGWEEYKDGFIFYSLGNFAFNKGKGIQNPRSLSVILEYNGSKLSYQIVPTIFFEKTVGICNDLEYSEYLKNLNLILTDPTAYMQKIESLCTASYHNIYKDTYLKVACKYRSGLLGILKSFVKRLMNKNGIQDIWLYHNLNIETHYFICKRASRLSMHKKGVL